MSTMSLSLQELQSEAGEDTSPILKFPVSPGCFHPTGTKRQEYLEIVREHVCLLLAQEHQYMERRDQHLPSLDPTKWKLIERTKEIRFFKRVRADQTLRQLASEEPFPGVQRAVENGYSSIMCDGQVRGSMEDIMYGMTASSQQDLMTGFWYKHPPRDCVWLGSAERPTPEDPFRSADFIWVFPKLSYHVDMCYLKATGIEKDQDGKSYGYLVLHSVEIPHCRPFEARKISRAKMYFACLFRETTLGYLHVRVRGIFDFGKRRGIITKKCVTAATKSFMIDLLDGVQIGLAKKLTIMARWNQEARRRPKQLVCGICFKTTKRRLFGLDMHLSQCGVCGVTACSTCIVNTKQILFLGLNAPCSKHTCCSTCMRDARTMSGVRPEKSRFHVVAEYYLTRQSQLRLTLNSPDRCRLNQTYSLDTAARSSRLQSAAKSTVSANMATNSTAAESLNTNSFFSELDEPEFCCSDDEDNSSIAAEPDLRTNMSDELEKSTPTVWQLRYQVDDDDFVPAGMRPCSEFEKFHRTLVQLNIAAENTYLQTQTATWKLRYADLD